MKNDYVVLRKIGNRFEIESRGHKTAKGAKEYISKQKGGVWGYEEVFHPNGEVEEKD